MMYRDLMSKPWLNNTKNNNVNLYESMGIDVSSTIKGKSNLGGRVQADLGWSKTINNLQEEEQSGQV